MMIIFDSTCFDMTTFSILYLFYFDIHNTTTVVWSLALCSALKLFTQDNLLFMTKPEGFNWYFPGVYSIMVIYWDILDFFYSGHISTAFILAYCCYVISVRHPHVAMYRYIANFWIYFKIPYVWIMMTWLRTHFIIDLTAGVGIAFLMTRGCETLSYYLEVKLCGMKTKDRQLLYYLICPKCGWSNDKATLLIDD